MSGELSVAENLRRRVLADIDSGVLERGSRLGSERELSEMYGVSRATLRQVLAALEEAGLVRRVVGRGGGTFITHSKVDHDAGVVVGLPAYLSQQGYEAGTHVIATKVDLADAETRRALNLGEGDLVVDIRRLRLADGRPLSLDRARLPADRFPGLLDLPLGGSVYALLEEHFAVDIGHAREVVEVVHATGDEAALLGVEPGVALMAVTRTAYDLQGAAFEFSYDLFRSDRIRITIQTPGRGLRGAPTAENQFATITAVE